MSSILVNTEPAGITALASASVAAPLVSEDLSRKVVHLYRGWHDYENNNGGPGIVDFDLSDLPGRDIFSSRRQILDSLIESAQKLEGFSFPEAVFLRSRLGGSIMYLRALMGEQIPFPKYLRATLGIDANPIPTNEISSSRMNVEKHLAARGLKYSAECLAAFEETFVNDPDRIKHEILSQKDVWLKRLAQAGIPVPVLLPLEVKFDVVDAYWSNWIDGSSHSGLTLTINLHKRVRYDEGKGLYLCLHEICGHAVQMSIWRNLIQSGVMSQACGITNVHSPEALLSEGLGETVSDLFPECDLPIAFRISKALRRHTMLVLHNAHISLYRGIPFKDIFNELQLSLPFSKADELEAQLTDRGTHLLFRSYLLSYSAGEAAIRKIIRSGTMSKQKLFQVLYSIPMDTQQLMSLGDEPKLMV